MASNEQSSTLIWVAIITLVGSIGVAVINNWDKINKPTSITLPTGKDSSFVSSSSIPIDKKTKLESQNNKTFDRTQTPINSVIPKNIKEEDAKSFSGHVQFSQGQSVVGAKIVCTNCKQPGQIAYSDQDGRFTLPFAITREGQVQMIHLQVSKGAITVEDDFSIGDEAIVYLKGN